MSPFFLIALAFIGVEKSAVYAQIARQNLENAPRFKGHLFSAL